MTDTNETVSALKAEVERLEDRLLASEVNRTMVDSYRADRAKERAERRKNAEAVNDWRDRYNRERLVRDQFESSLHDTAAQLAAMTAERDAARQHSDFADIVMHVSKDPAYQELAWRERDAAIADLHREQERVGKLEREIRLLREYGNKDCTAQADEAIGADRKAKP